MLRPLPRTKALVFLGIQLGHMHLKQFMWWLLMNTELEKKMSLPEGWVLKSKCLCPPPLNSYVEILTPKDDGIGRWGLWGD